VHDLVERQVQVEVAPFHAAESAEVVPEPGPEAFDAVGMDLTHPVTVVVSGPLSAFVVHQEPRPPAVVEVVVGVPLVGVHLAPRFGHAQHHGLDGLRGAAKGLAQEHLAGLPTDDPEDGRAIVVEGAVAVEPERASFGNKFP
jgi:hypothetical protein